MVGSGMRGCMLLGESGGWRVLGQSFGCSHWLLKLLPKIGDLCWISRNACLCLHSSVVTCCCVL